MLNLKLFVGLLAELAHLLDNHGTRALLFRKTKARRFCLCLQRVGPLGNLRRAFFIFQVLIKHHALAPVHVLAGHHTVIVLDVQRAGNESWGEQPLQSANLSFLEKPGEQVWPKLCDTCVCLHVLAHGDGRALRRQSKGCRITRVGRHCDVVAKTGKLLLFFFLEIKRNRAQRVRHSNLGDARLPDGHAVEVVQRHYGASHQLAHRDGDAESVHDRVPVNPRQVPQAQSRQKKNELGGQPDEHQHFHEPCDDFAAIEKLEAAGGFH
mmetsp:Transcript_31541/g.86897  ORF Transcript_31541/g.86897 Transcript_31541/m.86897 type:complete len:266 (-) Transcript_31541:969-1766(-)